MDWIKHLSWKYQYWRYERKASKFWQYEAARDVGLCYKCKTPLTHTKKELPTSTLESWKCPKCGWHLDNFSISIMAYTTQNYAVIPRSANEFAFTDTKNKQWQGQISAGEKEVKTDIS